MPVTTEELERAAKEWSSSLAAYKKERTHFYDLVVKASAEGWTPDAIYRASAEYASKDDIGRILRAHRKST